MEIDLGGALVALEGGHNPIVDAAFAALRANGGVVATGVKAAEADILLISCPLLPGGPAEDAGSSYAAWRAAAEAMAGRGGGRIVFLMSAVAGLPIRRQPALSMESASMLAGMRALAMEFGPHVLVNAVGVGLVEDGGPVAGDPAMLSHAAVGRAGTVDEAVAAVLFFCDPMNTYTTGQMLGVDGGWAAGYGRNF